MIPFDSGNNSINTTIGFVCGILGGSVDFLLRIQFSSLTIFNPLIIFAMLQAAFTALLCGAAGVAGKELYTKRKKILYYIVKKLTRKK